MQLFLDKYPTIDVMTHSSSVAAGGGGISGGDWFYFNFALDNPSWSSLHINYKEMLAIMLAGRRWAPL